MKRLHTTTWAIVVIFGTLSGEISCSVNLALRKPTKQSSKQSFWDSSDKAVDGNTNADFSAGSCIRTNRFPGYHWWQVDLQDSYIVSYINITNRADCCDSSLAGFSVEISEEEPSSLPRFPRYTNAAVCMRREDPVPVTGPVTFECYQPVKGRYVRVVKLSPMNSPLLICEFEVYGHLSGPINLALGKPATQSSTYKHHQYVRSHNLAYKAVDGNRNGVYSQASCTHTWDNYDFHWWQVDLQDTYSISAVRLTNRIDCCSERLQGFTIEVSEEEPSTLPGFPKPTNAADCLIYTNVIPNSGPFMLECDQPVIGRYLRIVMNIKKAIALTLCEVEVFGEIHVKPSEAPGGGRMNGENGMWRFIYIANGGTKNMLDSRALAKLMVDCAHQRIDERTDLYTNPYIHVDLGTGACRFFENVPDRSAHPSPNWVMYKLE